MHYVYFSNKYDNLHRAFIFFYSAVFILSPSNPLPTTDDIKPFASNQMRREIQPKPSFLPPDSATPGGSFVYVLPHQMAQEQNANNSNTPRSNGRWRDDETQMLVDLWKERITSGRCRKGNKNVRVHKEMWDEISRNLLNANIHRTASQCQIRMKNLIQYYRQVKDQTSPEELPTYFQAVGHVFGTKGNISPPHLMDTHHSVSYDPEVDDMSGYMIDEPQATAVAVPIQDQRSPTQTQRNPQQNQITPTHTQRNPIHTQRNQPHSTSHLQSQPPVPIATTPFSRPTLSSATMVPLPSPPSRTSDDHERGSLYLDGPARKKRYTSRDKHNAEDETGLLRDFVQLQQKQLDYFHEIEQRRLQLEERRLILEEESDKRQEALLMEMLKMLANNSSDT